MKDCVSLKDCISTFENTIVGDRFNEQLLNIENNFKQYSTAYIFLLAGTFGTSDILDFEYNDSKLYCNITIPDPSTEGLMNLFIALIIEGEDISYNYDDNLVVNYINGGKK